MEREDQITMQDILDWTQFELSNLEKTIRHSGVIGIALYTLFISCLVLIVSSPDSPLICWSWLGLVSVVLVIVVRAWLTSKRIKHVRAYRNLAIEILSGRVESTEKAFQTLEQLHLAVDRTEHPPMSLQYHREEAERKMRLRAERKMRRRHGDDRRKE